MTNLRTVSSLDIKDTRYQLGDNVGKRIRATSKTIGYHFNPVVSHELIRNSNKNGYNSEEADSKDDLRRETARKVSKHHHKMNKFIRSFLRVGWSPEVISLRLMYEVKQIALATPQFIDV